MSEIKQLECSLKISQEKHRLCIARLEALEGALRKIYLWDEAGGGCKECSAGSIAREALAATEQEGEG